MEIWSSIPEHPGYEISSKGRVRYTKNGVYKYIGNGGVFVIKNKQYQITRTMAEVFLNEGRPLPRNKVVTGKPDLLEIKILPAAYHVRRTKSKQLVEEYCIKNTINDVLCQEYVRQYTGVVLKPKTIRAYRLAAGFKKPKGRNETKRSDNSSV